MLAGKPMSRAKIIALRNQPVPVADTGDLSEDLTAIKSAIANIKGPDLQPILDRLAGINDAGVLAAITRLETTIKGLEARVKAIETKKAEKRKLAFDVVTDAAGEIRQIIAKEM